MAEPERRRLYRLKPNMERRALIYQHIRDFFQKEGFLEIETPIRMPEVAPEQHIAPCAAEDWLLSTSPELHMKRLMSADYDKIFQFGRCFRKGEKGRWHNPEFTLLEWYRAGADYQTMIHDTEKLVSTVAKKLGGKNTSYRGQKIDLSLPWPRITVSEAFRKSAGWDPTKDAPTSTLDSSLPDSRSSYGAGRWNDKKTSGNVGKKGGNDTYFEKFDVDLVTKVVPDFAPNHPTILLDYPAALGSLARLKPGNRAIAERAEVFIGGLELANAFSELKDVAEQTRRFRDEIREIGQMTGQQRNMPKKFLKALSQMPECGGIALGVDRLVMLFCDAAAIEEVLPFPSDKI